MNVEGDTISASTNPATAFNCSNMTIYSKMMPFGLKGGLQETTTLESERGSQRMLDVGPGPIILEMKSKLCWIQMYNKEETYVLHWFLPLLPDSWIPPLLQCELILEQTQLGMGLSL